MIRNPNLLRNITNKATTKHLIQRHLIQRHLIQRHFSSKKSVLNWNQFEDVVKEAQSSINNFSVDTQIDKNITDAIKTLGLINNKMTELQSDSTTATVSFNVGIMQVSFSCTSNLKKID
jgi:hypothetical protein